MDDLNDMLFTWHVCQKEYLVELKFYLLYLLWSVHFRRSSHRLYTATNSVSMGVDERHALLEAEG